MTRKQKLADSFNTMYQWVVNQQKPFMGDTQELENARKFISSGFSKLDLSVMEFLAIYMIKNPNGTIEFVESKKEVLDLICKDEDELRRLTFNYDGIIVQDSKSILSQKGE